MREVRTFDEFTFDETGHTLLREERPDTIIAAFMSVLARCALPRPFPRATKLAVNRWMPQLDAEANFPMITWKVIHTVPSDSTPREFQTHTHTASSKSVAIFQMKFNHIVQFNCMAATQEEVSALEWWLIRQLYIYRHVLAETGAQHLRFHESQEQSMVGLPQDRYPIRQIRFTFQTVMTFNSARINLKALHVRTLLEAMPITETELVTKGDDQLSNRYVIDVIEVSNEEGNVLYDPMYRPSTNTLIWKPDQVQPADGEQYSVTYVYVGSEALVIEEDIVSDS